MSYSTKKYLREFEEKIDTAYKKTDSDLNSSTDEIMYSNARALEIYGRGKRFDIEDNIILYEVVKIVREIVDKHFYQPEVRFFIQVADRQAEFTFIVDKTDAKYSYFIETLFMFISGEIYRTYGDYFILEREDELLEDNKVKLKITVKKNEEEVE